ncbi:Zn-ribbon domain-containing OB-fold protein [Spirillospora sp. CA-255316]
MSEADAEFPEVPFVVEPGIEPYWDGAARNRLILSRCTEDDRLLWPPRPFCPRHMTAPVRWDEVGGGGVVYSYTVVHRGEGAFATVSPYVLAYVELDEGPRILTNLRTPAGRTDLDVHIGQRVRARFDAHGGGSPVLRFEV